MVRKLLDADISTRVTKSIKREFERLADLEHLDASDIYRRALREFLERQKKSVTKPA